MKSISIISLICLASCMSENKKQVKPGYDEAGLKDFVMALTGPDKEKQPD